MKMIELIRYDLPEDIVALWQREEGKRLLPLQARAIKQHGLFSQQNLLIQAPTSSGKTFIGEMAALQTAMRRKKVVYLVPLKALAEEKYRDFAAKYTAYGLKVLLSTRDHRDHDRALESGDFSIAVVVYEKLAQLLVRRPERLQEIDLVVADELEMLSDPERGGGVELLLTRILQARRRLIGLSAVIGGAERLAQWLEAELLQYERRPVELHYGVLYEGLFQYRGYNSAEEGQETLCDAGDAAEEGFWDILLHTLRRFTQQEAEGCLVFVKAKHETRRGAACLAAELDLPAATTALAELEDLEDTRSRRYLQETLSGGVAFHNADLSPDERRVVETAFRRGEVRVLVSTSTLAVGLNLPARNVFMLPEKWRYDARLAQPWKAPLLRSEYENMSGRAGRYGAGHDFGRAILIARSPYDRETLWRRYVEGGREQITPQLDREPLENHVLRLVASRYCRTVGAVTRFLQRSLTGQWVWAEQLTQDEETIRVRAAVYRGVDYGVLQLDPEDRLAATPLGLAIASKGITLESARTLEGWLSGAGMRHWNPLELLVQVACCEDGRNAPVMLTMAAYTQGVYPELLRQRLAEEGSSAAALGMALRGKLAFEDVRSLKTALLLYDWIAMTPLRRLEEDYNCMAGQVLAAAEQCSWLVEACVALAEAMGMPGRFVRKLQTLARRLAHGVEAEALPLCALGIEGLTRNVLLAWQDADLLRPEALLKAPPATLREYLQPEAVKQLRQWARAMTRKRGERAKDGSPVLRLDRHRPGEVFVGDQAVTLQEKQYRLLQVLAAHPGECVAYDDIYHAVWGDHIVEPNQMHVQKRQLLRCLERAGCPVKPLIKTVPKRGFTLMLSPQQVEGALAMQKAS